MTRSRDTSVAILGRNGGRWEGMVYRVDGWPSRRRCSRTMRDGGRLERVLVEDGGVRHPPTCDLDGVGARGGDLAGNGWRPTGNWPEIPVIQLFCESGSNFIWTSSSCPFSTSSICFPALAWPAGQLAMCLPATRICNSVLICSPHRENHLVERDRSFCGNTVCFKRRVPCDGTPESLPWPTTRHSGDTDSAERKLPLALSGTYYGLSDCQIRDH